jgi:hypothetical protein
MSWLKRILGGHADAASSAHPTGEPAPRRSVGEASFAPALRSRPIPDLVDGLNALAAYFRYVEGMTYDAGLRSARDRRDFRSDLEKRVRAILAYEHDENAAGQIQYELDKESQAFGSGSAFRDDADVAVEARRLAPEGFRLFGLTPNFTVDALKSAYRKAAKTHHPDVGGSTASMQVINDAYNLFVGLLNRQTARNDSADAAPRFGFSTVEAFFQSVHFQQWSMLVDDLAADVAYDAYRTMKLGVIESRYGGPALVARLCELLAACDRTYEAAAVLRDLDTLAKHGERRELNFKPIYNKTALSCAEPTKIRFIPNHARQAANLLRLGIIDQARYDAVMKRIGSAGEKLADDAAAFVEFIRSRPFLRLPMDPPVDESPSSGLVPGPDYYSRVEAMSPAQQAEYTRAFYSSAPDLASKYLGVRLDALLRTPFQSAGLLGPALAELQAFKAAGCLKPGMAVLCEEAIKVLSFLAGLQPPARAQRVDLLNSLDGIPGQYALTIGGMLSFTVIPRPIFLNPDFTTFATGPLERIERYKRTGWEDTPEERAEKHRQWEDGHAFRESPVYKRATAATWAKDKDPEVIVGAVAELCEAIYRRAADSPDDAMDVGYWTDKLTANLVKLRRFPEALSWLERFEAAPTLMRARCAAGVSATMRKRLERCRVEVAKRARQ